MIGIATMTSKNQITIPAELVKLLGWVNGTRVWVNIVDGKTIKMEKTGSIRDLQGFAADSPMVKKYKNWSFEEIKKTTEYKKAEYEEAKRIANGY